MADTRVIVVGRDEPRDFLNATYTIHPDGDLEIWKGRTNQVTLAFFARGQWQSVEDLNR